MASPSTGRLRHEAGQHEGHVDYVHDGHKQALHGDHYDEH